MWPVTARRHLTPRKPARTARYDLLMRAELEGRRSRPPVLRRVFAGLVLIAAAALIIHLAVGLVVAVFWTVVVVAAVVAVLWALKTLIW